MSRAEHSRAVRAALGVDGELKRLFAQLGSAEHPNGRVLRAYRVARRALRASGGLQAGAVAETLGELRAAMRQVTGETLAAAAGAKSARAQLEAYGVPVRPTYYATSAAQTAWLATVESQAAAVQAAVATGAEAELVVGDDTQPGMLNPSGPTRDGAKWAAVAAQGAWWAWIEASEAGRPGGRRSQDELLKQAVAAIDERTTECCLMAHGQVQGLEEDFELRGRPRYADRLQWVPFHWYCRSSVALVRRADAEDSLTQELLEAAVRELRAREAAGRVEIHPSHGRSGR